MSDQSKRIIYTNAEGGLSVVVPAPNTGLTIQEVAEKSIPYGTPYEIIDVATVPSDRTFRNAWKHDIVKKVDVDMVKAKDITHTRRRAKRTSEFAPHDEIIMKQIPGNDAQAAEQARAAIRAKYDAMQIEIDACGTADALKAIIVREGL